MADIKIEEVKRFLNAIKHNKQKHLTCEVLSRDIGLYPDVIAKTLSYFDPLITMDMDYEIRDLVPALENYLKEKDIRKPVKKLKTVLPKKYKSLNDFIFEKFAVGGGLMDRSIELSDKDLVELKKIIINEQKNRKKKI